MALVKCPECGKENVSDSAVACPACGYGIKEHYERLRKEQEKIRLQEEAKKKAEEKRLLDLEKEKEKKRTEKARQEETLNKLNNELKSNNKTLLITTFLTPIFLILLVLCWKGSLRLGSLFFFSASLVSGFILIFSASSYDSIKNEIEAAKKDINQYEKEEEIRTERAKRQNQIRYDTEHPQCPLCGSRNTERITTANRVLSVATTGLASSKIGKQYKCNNCKHLW